jgi:hypothetical protein
MTSFIASSSSTSLHSTHHRIPRRRITTRMSFSQVTVVMMAAAILLLSSTSLAQSNFKAINNATTLTGTWSSGSQAVTTGLVSITDTEVSKSTLLIISLFCRVFTIQSPRTLLCRQMPVSHTHSQTMATLRRLPSHIQPMVSKRIGRRK